MTASHFHPAALTTLHLPVETHAPEHTVAAAHAFAADVRAGDVIALVGPLGSGKTVFARGMIARLAGAQDQFQGSPTFALVQEYHCPAFPLYHFDFFRIKSAQELLAIGWQEYCTDASVCIVEWADRFPELLPPHAQWLAFSAGSGTLRRIQRRPA